MSFRLQEVERGETGGNPPRVHQCTDSAAVIVSALRDTDAYSHETKLMRFHVPVLRRLKAHALSRPCFEAPQSTCCFTSLF